MNRTGKSQALRGYGCGLAEKVPDRQHHVATGNVGGQAWEAVHLPVLLRDLISFSNLVTADGFLFKPLSAYILF